MEEITRLLNVAAYLWPLLEKTSRFECDCIPRLLLIRADHWPKFKEYWPQSKLFDETYKLRVYRTSQH
jgi:hypothetical protein